MAKPQQPQQPQIQLPPVIIVAAGITQGQQQQNLMICQQAPGYPDTVITLADAISKRAETVMLDFTAQSVAVRYQIDGMWHDLPPRDRASGDAMLAVMKKLADLNPDDRRARQQGQFGAEFMGKRFNAKLTSQGTQTGERAALTFELSDKKKRPKFEKLTDLGMREKMIERFKESCGFDAGLVLISAPPKHGLTTTWNTALNATDRFMRDFVSLEDKNNPEEEVINIGPNFYDSAAGQTPESIMRVLMLREPDVLVVPELVDGKTVDALCDQIIDADKLVIARIQAKNAPEAILRVLALKASAERVAKSLKAVLNQRLVRRLCENCKQAYPPAPQLLQKLGIPAGRVQVLYREWQPPPQPMVDEQGNPIQPPICPQCGGIGYFGRLGIFEFLEVSDPLRQAIIKQPQLEALQQVAKSAGHRGLQDEAILSVCLGHTSLTEIQRVLKQ